MRAPDPAEQALSVLEDLSWWLKRMIRRASRLAASVVLRGWQGTLGHLLQREAGADTTSRAPGSTFTSPKVSGRQILVIEETVPDPTRDSGSLRLQSLMELLVADGWSVNLLCTGGRITESDIARLAHAGVTLHRANPLTWLRTNGQGLEVAMLCRAPVAAQYMASVRRHAPRAVLVFDTVDLHFLREQRAAKLLGRNALPAWLAARRRRELQLVASSDLCLVVSAEERTLLARETPGSRIEVLSNIHEVHGRRAAYEQRRGLLFIGGFSHPPNLDAMQWFINAVFPMVSEAQPGIQVHVVGHLTPAATRLLTRDGVVLHGQIPDLEPLLEACRISIAPLRFGAGVKGKVNTAMSHGLPVVATSVAAEGMHLTDGIDALIADGAEEFANAVVRLYRDPDLWMRLSERGLANVGTHFSPAVARDTLRRLFPDPGRS